MNTEKANQKTKEIHQGKNVKRFREMRNKNQDVLADEIGVSQQTISLIESQETVKDEYLNKIAGALNISVNALKRFDDETAMNIISNTFNEQSIIAYQYNFNPIDKIIELYNEKIILHERLLKAEQEKNELLEKFLKEKEKYIE